MRVRVITPPEPVVTWNEADAHLRLAGDTSEQAYVESLIAAATEYLDGPSGWLGRSLGVQTLEARFDWFDPCGIRLPYPPVIEVETVKYLDAANVEQVIDADQYELRGAKLVTAWQAAWPSTLGRPEAVRVQYRAGYETLPAPIRAAILLMVGDHFANRETAVIGAVAQEIPMAATVFNLLGPYKVWA